MLKSHASQPESLPHLCILTGQLLLVRCFDGERNRWKAAYPEQAKKHSFPYTRAVLLKQTFETLSLPPFVQAGSTSPVGTGSVAKRYAMETALTGLRSTLNGQEQRMKSMLSRLPSAGEMKQRNAGKKSQEILMGEQAEAALDIVRNDQKKAGCCLIVKGLEDVVAQLYVDVSVCGLRMTEPNHITKSMASVSAQQSVFSGLSRKFSLGRMVHGNDDIDEVPKVPKKASGMGVFSAIGKFMGKSKAKVRKSEREREREREEREREREVLCCVVVV